MNVLENIPYDEIAIGQTATYSQTLTEQHIILFAAVSGDINPIHLDRTYAAGTAFGEPIGHGAWTASLISAAIALKLPGPGSIYLSQALKFRKPVKIGDTVTIYLEVTDKRDRTRSVTIACEARNQDDVLLARGTAEAMAPEEKLSLEAPTLPPITVG